MCSSVGAAEDMPGLVCGPMLEPASLLSEAGLLSEVLARLFKTCGKGRAEACALAGGAGKADAGKAAPGLAAAINCAGGGWLNTRAVTAMIITTPATSAGMI